uniref:Ankyrin repeat domain 33B n=1 Tax=Gopherus evgoodei TaxID=1825980 RepID=A0A8C4VQK5_9SAUR
MVLLSGDGTGAGESRGPGESLKGKQQEVWPNSRGEKDAQGLEGEQQEQVVAAAEEEEDYEEYEDFSELPDTCSIASDDSFYPPCAEEDEEESWSLRESDVSSPEQLSLFRACCTNNAVVLRALMRQGPEEEEVRETDRNNRTGLIVACYQGFVDIVIALAQCPHVDVNWQDNEGNTALITAAQAGKALSLFHLYVSDLRWCVCQDHCFGDKNCDS